MLGWEDPLEKGVATHSSILAWRIPWTEEPGSPWVTKSQTQLSNKHTLTDTAVIFYTPIVHYQNFWKTYQQKCVCVCVCVLRQQMEGTVLNTFIPLPVKDKD